MKRMILSAALAAAMMFGVAVSAGAQDVKKEGQQTEQTEKKDCPKDKKQCCKDKKKHCNKDGKHCDKKSTQHCDKAKADDAKKEVK